MADRFRVVAVGHKSYLGHARTLAWLEEAARAGAEVAGVVDVVVFPVAPALPVAVALAHEGGLQVGAQDVSEHPAGAWTGELPASLLAEIGVRWAEVGHAERRHLFGEGPEVVARKVAAAVGAGLTPLLCVGEGRLGDTRPLPPDEALRQAGEQLRSGAPADRATPFVVAYEPVWAIGADAPAPVAHVQEVAAGLRALLEPYPEARLVYGGTAGPGLFAELRDDLDGLFLGRRAHDVAAFAQVLAEVAAT